MSALARGAVLNPGSVRSVVLSTCKSVVSPGCILISVSWPYKSDIVLHNNKVTKEGTVLIEENAWIGAGSIILPNSTLGKRSILGAGSTLTKKTKDNEIWYGVPAAFKRKLI